MTEYRVVLPQECYTVVKFEENGFPGIGVVNSALVDFEPKIVFGWELSLMIECDDCNEQGLPSASEMEIVHALEDRLDALVKADGNALYLGHYSHDSLRRRLWRVHDPEKAHTALQGVITQEQYSREFDYEMTQDPKWERSRWLLDGVRKSG